MEKILSIVEASVKMPEYGYGDGYVITTDKQKISMAISNSQSCCENWGYFWSNDNVEEFIGANLLSVKLTDDCLNEAKFKDELEYGVYDGGLMFINFETDIGTLQFTVYNAHNGYYSHAAFVKCEQLNVETYL